MTSIVEVSPVPEASFVAENSGGSLARNAGALLIGQAIGLGVPIVTIPYLARVLGPASWGPVLAAQAFANWLILIFEFGFELSGARAVARARVSPETLPEVVHGVQSAKSVLVVTAVPVIALVLLAAPALRRDPRLVVCALVFAVLRGLSPLWFFQGIERLQAAVTVDTVTRSAAALAVFALVHDPNDGWRVLALQAGLSAVSLAVLMAWLARHVRLRRPTVAAGLKALREGSSIFACRAWSGLYIQGNALILAGLAGPSIVAFFGGAERIIRAAINLLQPLTQAFLPRISYLHAADPASAWRMTRRALVGVTLLGAAMGLVAFVAAPILVHVLLGDGYGAAIAVLRLLAALPVLIAANTVLGLYWALPFGHERALLVSIIAAGVTNVSLALVLVPRLGASGMAASAIGAEVVALAFLGSRYLRSWRTA